MVGPSTAELTEGDLVASAVQKVLAALSAADMLGSEVGQDGVGGQPAGPFSAGWVFSAFNNDGSPLRKINSTGLSCVTLQARDSWGSNRHNTQLFPLLVARIETDCARDAMGNVAARDADMRCKRVSNVVKGALEDPSNSDHEWPLGVYVNTSVCSSQLSISDVPDSDGSVYGVLRFEISLV